MYNKDIKLVLEGNMEVNDALNSDKAVSMDSVGLPEDYGVLNTGLRGFDDSGYIRANQPDIIIVASRPGVGKTLLALQIGYQISRGMPVLFYSLEMTKEQLRARLVKTGDYRRGEGNLHVNDNQNLDIDQIINETLSFNKKNGLGLMVIDYTQIVNCHGRSKKEEVATVMSKLKLLAKELSRPILALAQRNRNNEGSQEDNFITPTLSDIADSDDIGKWADSVIILHEVPKTDGQIKAFVPKFRHGPRKDFVIELKKGEYVRFDDYEKF